VIPRTRFGLALLRVFDRSSGVSTLPPELVEFLSAGVAHQIGACDRTGRPSICRALGAIVDEHGRVVVMLSGESGFEVLDAIRETGLVSAVFVQPSTYRTLHVKGRDAQVAPAAPEHRALIPARREAFLQQIARYGFTRDFVMAWYTVPDEQLMAITFTPIGAWNQTPGPGAGGAIELSS
jgi:hypothetical protein